jgi:LPS-assembly lipoprotein
MSLFKIIPFLLIFLLYGCGFQTVYNGSQQESFNESSKIMISPLPDRIGQILRNNLMFALNPKGHKSKPEYILKIRLSESSKSLALRETAFATRVNLTVKSEFNLTRIKDKESLYSGISNISVSYNILKSDYATIAVKKNALTRGLSEVSRNIHSQLEVYFSRIPN